MKFDFLAFIQAALPIVGFLTPLVMGFVQLLGKLGVAGIWQLVASAVSGLALGMLAMLASLGVPADFAGWFSYVIVGLVTGLTASGVYEAVQHAASKAIVKAGQ